MKRSILAKALTLITFFSLIILFVLYHSGTLERYFTSAHPIIPSSSNGGAILMADSIKPNNTDSISNRNSRYLKMIKQAKKNAESDLAVKNVAKPDERQLRLLSSSKSIQVLNPKKMPFKMDSLMLDSILSKKY